MNGTTILIWINIIIVAAIAIIIVKLHYKHSELENDENSILTSNPISNTLVSLKGKIGNKNDAPKKENKPTSNIINRKENDSSASNNENFNADEISTHIIPDVKNINFKDSIEYESPNQVLVDYGSEVKKFQEPIKQNQMDIMNQSNNSNEKHELKDLFTIDELIKESKRKDDEREKESKKINDEDEGDLSEIKESIKLRKENKISDKLIEEVETESDKDKNITDGVNDETSIAEAIKTEENNKNKSASLSSQKDIDDAIESAKENKKEDESISNDNITDTLLDDNKDIKSPTLKTPKKIDANRKDEVSILSGDDEDYKFGGQLEDSELFNDEMNDLDYRKDIAKVTNKLKNSRILQDVKDKLIQEEESPNEAYIRNVNEYDDYAPIINETHVDIDADYETYHEKGFEDRIRRENARKMLDEIEESKIGPIKSKPERANIKIELNNSEVVINKGDEIIFNHDGDTYSSQVYAINGDEISVRYRRKNITIKPSDVKKVY